MSSKKPIKVTKSTISKALQSVSACDVIHLAPGDYNKPVVLSNAVGTAERPIIIESADCAEFACFTKQMSAKTYTKTANKIAARREAGGYYPSTGQTADEAMLILRNCQYVIVRNLRFIQCWPGGIYLDQCQQILIDNIDFREGTIAIGASGDDTRDITVQNCFWKQDISKTNDMWNKVAWIQVHGASDNQNNKVAVNLKNDMRAWDGDFFRAWSIIGNVTLRNNSICDAFNGIHFFNGRDELAPNVNPNAFKFNGGRKSSANVLIENNVFVRVRDNCIEPEDHAWNWVVRYNKIVDCYRPFSFEFKRAGWFYIYGNTGVFNNAPSKDVKGKDPSGANHRRSMSLFKVKGKQENEGEIYVFHNSWFYKECKGIFPKGQLGRLVHFNNAIGYTGKRSNWFFGDDGLIATALPYDEVRDIKAEKRRFTRRWVKYQIRFEGDFMEDDAYPKAYQATGYPIGKKVKSGDPMFADILPRKDVMKYDLTPKINSPLIDKAKFKELNLPSNSTFKTLDKINIGAIQRKKNEGIIDGEFGFFTDNEWTDKIPNLCNLIPRDCD